jgi:Golgi phosphoprotein 3 (GPP34)
MHTLPLADEFFLVGHDEYSGKPRVNAEVVHTGLAGAVLAELVLTGRATIADGFVVTRDQRPYGEHVTDAALAEILKQHDAHPVRSWVEYLREDVRDMVSPRLVSAGLVQRVQMRSMLRHTVRFPATDPIRAIAPQARLRYIVDHPDMLDSQSGMLAALVRVTGLEHVIGAATGREARELLGRIADQLPENLRAIAAGVDAAVANIALTVRR